MAKSKFDVVIEAVRYTLAGEISLARAYERRGPTFGDHVLLTREQLIQLLQTKKRLVTGIRVEYLAGTFAVTGEVRLVGAHITTRRDDPGRDLLENVPLF